MKVTCTVCKKTFNEVGVVAKVLQSKGIPVQCQDYMCDGELKSSGVVGGGKLQEETVDEGEDDVT